MTHVRQCLLSIAIFNLLYTTLRMQKYVVNLVNIETDNAHTCISKELEVCDFYEMR